jgi:8-oxo-dGTP diphosphatase
VRRFEGEPRARVFEQICWVEFGSLETLDFLDGDLDFVKRLARGDYARVLTA